MQMKKKLNDAASSLVAFLIVIAILSAVIFLFRHFLATIFCLVWVFDGFLFAAVFSDVLKKRLTTLGSKPWVKSPWTLLLFLLASVLCIYYPHPVGLWISSTLFFLQIFITATKDNATKSVVQP